MKTWTVAKVEDTDITAERVSGTKRQVKKYLLALIKKDCGKLGAEHWRWSYGTTSVDGNDGVRERKDGRLYAYAALEKEDECGDCAVIDFYYAAFPEKEARILD
jgi:hypothetical protein